MYWNKMRYNRRKQPRSKYRSRFEERLALALEQAKVNFSYETLRLPYTVERVYTPDFILPNGVIVEAKGFGNLATEQNTLLYGKLIPMLIFVFVF